MSLQFYLGSSGSGKSFQLHKDVNEWAGKDLNKNFLFIVPDQFTMQTQMELVLSSPNNGIMNIDVLSFNRLAHRIFEELGLNNAKVLDDTGKSLILRKLTKDKLSELQVIGKNINKIGYIHEIKSIISEFKQYDISDEKLEEIIERVDDKKLLSMKLKDIQRIYKTFNDYTRNEYVTTEETLSLLTDVIDQSKIIKNSVVVFDGFTGFTPVQYRLIRRLLELTEKVIVSVTIDIQSNPYKIFSEQELFYLSKKTIFDLQRIAGECNVALADDVILNETKRYDLSRELSHLEKNIFRYPATAYEDVCTGITITESNDINEEINNTCVAIKNLVLDHNYEYREIAVVCGDISAYADGFINATKQYDIPVFVDQNSKLIFNPVVEYLRSALWIIKDDFTYDSVFHFLRSGMTDFDYDDIDLLDNYVTACGISGRRKYEQLFTRSVSILNHKANADDDVQIELLNRINEIRSRLCNMLRPLLAKLTTVKDYTNALSEFININGIDARLKEYEDNFANINDLKRVSEYRQILPLITDLINSIGDILDDDEISIDEFIHTFESGVDEIDVGSIPAGVDRVLIGDIERSRIPQIKVLFFVGVNDGNVPKANTKGGIISDFDREFLKENNIELSPTPREQIYTQRLYLYMNLTKPSEKLYISYAKASADGKELKASYLIKQIKQLFPSLPTIDSKMDNLFSKIIGVNDAVRVFSEEISAYANGTYELLNMNELLAVYKYLENNDEKLINSIVDTAFFEYKKTSISKELAYAIYGSILSSSISRLELFAKCEYAHFLKYGVKIDKKDEFTFESVDLGNIYHNVMEEFSNKLISMGYTWADFPEEKAMEVLGDVVKDITTNYGAGVLYSSYTNEHVVTKIYDILKRSVITLKRQLNAGLFVPEGFEVPFEYDLKLDDSNKMILRGRIDRIDIHKKDKELLVKVIDFKSGKKDIELDNLLYGISIQQPVYMIEAMKKMSEKYPDYLPKMAAMLYYHIDNPVVAANSLNDESLNSIEDDLDTLLSPTGLVGDDERIINALDINTEELTSFKSKAIPVKVDKSGNITSDSKTISNEDFKTVNDYTNYQIEQNARKILNGNIAINPYKKNSQTACTYCEYKAICGFDSRQTGYKYRNLKALKDETALERMKECL